MSTSTPSKTLTSPCVSRFIQRYSPAHAQSPGRSKLRGLDDAPPSINFTENEVRRASKASRVYLEERGSN